MKLSELRQRLLIRKCKKVFQSILTNQRHTHDKKEETLFLLMQNIYENLNSINFLYRKKKYTSCYVVMRAALEDILIFSKLNKYDTKSFNIALAYNWKINTNKDIYTDYKKWGVDEQKHFELSFFMNMKEEYNSENVWFYQKFFGFQQLLKEIKEENKKDFQNFYHVLSQFTHPHYRQLIYYWGEKIGIKGAKRLRDKLFFDYPAVWIFALFIINNNISIPDELRLKIKEIYKTIDIMRK